jgi:hypothetical protein
LDVALHILKMMKIFSRVEFSGEREGEVKGAAVYYNVLDSLPTVVKNVKIEVSFVALWYT